MINTKLKSNITRLRDITSNCYFSQHFEYTSCKNGDLSIKMTLWHYGDFFRFITYYLAWLSDYCPKREIILKIANLAT